MYWFIYLLSAKWNMFVQEKSYDFAFIHTLPLLETILK